MPVAQWPVPSWSASWRPSFGFLAQCILEAKGTFQIATRSKEATNGAPGLTTIGARLLRGRGSPHVRLPETPVDANHKCLELSSRCPCIVKRCFLYAQNTHHHILYSFYDAIFILQKYIICIFIRHLSRLKLRECKCAETKQKEQQHGRHHPSRRWSVLACGRQESTPSDRTSESTARQILVATGSGTVVEPLSYCLVVLSFLYVSFCSYTVMRGFR